MSTKISALPAAVGGNVTDVTVLPLVDVTTTTVKVTVAQLRTQLSIGNQLWTGTAHVLYGSNGSLSYQDLGTATSACAVLTSNTGNGAWLRYIENVTNRWSIGVDTASGTFHFRPGAQNVPTVASLTSAGLFTTTTLAVTGASSFAGLVTIPSTVTSAAGAGTDIVLGATTQTTVGSVGGASALPANPSGYLVFYKGTTKYAIPYFNG